MANEIRSSTLHLSPPFLLSPKSTVVILFISVSPALSALQRSPFPICTSSLCIYKGQGDGGPESTGTSNLAQDICAAWSNKTIKIVPFIAAGYSNSSFMTLPFAYGVGIAKRAPTVRQISIRVLSRLDTKSFLIPGPITKR